MTILKTISKHWAWTLILVLAAILVFWAVRPTPIPVDITRTQKSKMIITIEDTGTTRVKNLFKVSTPIAGILERTTIEPGDEVSENSTIIATLHTTESPLLDPRTKQELLASRTAANAAIKLAKSEKQRAATALAQAKSDYDRAARMIVSDALSKSEMEHFKSNYDTARASSASAAANVELKLAELARIDAALNTRTDQDHDECCVDIPAPVSGKILSIFEKSERPVPAGTTVAEIGNTADMEIVSELTTQDAVKIKPDMPVRITNWGGDDVIHGKVKRVEPAAVTTISALGIEEQRVKVTISADNLPEDLGHGFHVDLAIETWEGDRVLQIPIGALFRFRGDWAAFSVDENNRANLNILQLGKMNKKYAEVLDGLEEDRLIILYPSDKIGNGSLVDPREVVLKPAA